jgi:hypothetical protein
MWSAGSLRYRAVRGPGLLHSRLPHARAARDATSPLDDAGSSVPLAPLAPVLQTCARARAVLLVVDALALMP